MEVRGVYARIPVGLTRAGNLAARHRDATAPTGIAPAPLLADLLRAKGLRVGVFDRTRTALYIPRHAISLLKRKGFPLAPSSPRLGALSFISSCKRITVLCGALLALLSAAKPEPLELLQP